MTSRQQRRAAEHKARKLVSKSHSQTSAVPDTENFVPANNSGEASENASENQCTELTPAAVPTPERELSPARLAANRANAQWSTGPSSPEGKANSFRNALKTALTGRTVLLPDDGAERYEQHLIAYEKAYGPISERECELVQSLADSTWRIDRIPGIEEAIYVKGCNQFAAEVTDLDPRARLTMLRMHTYLAYERQFRNLQIQEMRLHRLREKLIKEVKELQREREQKEKDELAQAAKLYIAAKTDRKPFDPADHGFEFSTADVEAYLHGVRANKLTEQAMQTGRLPLTQHAKAA
ncbi:MAG: hypothetical protein M3Y57_19345 [Acidobacteriota bacterium]|nr:hypothetical protein [Acidobacteriota bacterium]